MSIAKLEYEPWPLSPSETLILGGMFVAVLLLGIGLLVWLLRKPPRQPPA